MAASPQHEASEAYEEKLGETSGPPSVDATDTLQLRHTTTTRSEVKQWGVLKFRAYDDEDEQDWWFASIVCPLLAATLGPFANVLSIAAQVVSWRLHLVSSDGSPLDLTQQLMGTPYPDPPTFLKLNIVSLAFGYVGNLFLLANFTNRIRYIIALPATIIFWFISAGILIGILVAMAVYDPPSENGIYTQGFWYGVLASILYMICSILLMFNMLGYFLGHYPQHFNLTDSQRTLILQTMLFFIWLAGGAGIFTATEKGHGDWLYTDALYFCDVTILTVGFGDLYPTTDVGRGILFPYAIGGIIMLGLMVASISSFASDISKENVIKKRMENQRVRTIERSTQKSAGYELSGTGLKSQSQTEPSTNQRRRSSAISRRAARLRELHGAAEETDAPRVDFADPNLPPEKSRPFIKAVQRRGTMVLRATPLPLGRRKPRALILREEKDRFLAMRSIESSIRRWKGWTMLTASIIAFGLLWCCGAAVFYATEQDTQGLTYFQALYFCYVSLLTIGFGDLSPKSQAGRPFFVVWSLLAVPTMTILVSSMGDTVIHHFKRGTNLLADFTVLPKYGIWRDFIRRHQWLSFLDIEAQREKRNARKRIERGFEIGPAPAGEDEEVQLDVAPPTLAELAQEPSEPPQDWELGQKLARAIQRVVHETRFHNDKKYEYEEWVEFTELIRFTSSRRRRHKKVKHQPGEEDVEEDEGLIQWDWIGEDSPLMQEQSEPEFVLERLCESMARYTKHHVPHLAS